MHRRSYLFYLLIVLGASVIITVASCSSNEKVVSDKRLLMATTVKITAAGKDRQYLRESINKAFEEVKRVDRLMSFYNESSELSQLNQKARFAPYQVDRELFFVIDKCIRFGRITEGSFDITATSLNEPDGYKKISLNGSQGTVYFKDPKIKIDLSASAKGYAVDKAIESLIASKVESALVDAGGDIRVLGRYKGNNWSIGIRHPQLKDKIILKVNLSNKAIATSGNYFQRHIIDTHSLDKAKNEILSATVIASDCLTADILATSLFVMGEDGLRVIEGMDGIDGMLIIEEDGKIKIKESSNFHTYY